jgi:glycosyltransferase involved in cell wall biosynthesis
MAKYARKANVKVIFHVHELHSMLERVRYEDLKATLEIADLIITTSDCVSLMVRDMGIDRKAIKVWNPMIDFSEIKINPERVPQIKAKHQIPADAFVWVMSGSPSYQKGIDLFVTIAIELRSPSIYFVWLGSFQNLTGLNYLVECQIKKYKLKNVAFLSPSSEDYYDYLNIADGFVLTSREEPFGMVMIEAAYLGKPIVAFDSGGPSEFFTGHIGFVSDKLDIKDITKTLGDMADGQYHYNPDAYRERAAQHDVAIGMKYWEGIMDEFVRL